MPMMRISVFPYGRGDRNEREPEILDVSYSIERCSQCGGNQRPVLYTDIVVHRTWSAASGEEVGYGEEAIWDIQEHIGARL